MYMIIIAVIVVVIVHPFHDDDRSLNYIIVPAYFSIRRWSATSIARDARGSGGQLSTLFDDNRWIAASAIQQ
jgi:hypothetical protein